LRQALKLYKRLPPPDEREPYLGERRDLRWARHFEPSTNQQN